jgi:hypothetical protein
MILTVYTPDCTHQTNWPSLTNQPKVENPLKQTKKKIIITPPTTTTKTKKKKMPEASDSKLNCLEQKYLQNHVYASL